VVYDSCTHRFSILGLGVFVWVGSWSYIFSLIRMRVVRLSRDSPCDLLGFASIHRIWPFEYVVCGFGIEILTKHCSLSVGFRVS
jgi:hypothetical protein